MSNENLSLSGMLGMQLKEMLHSHGPQDPLTVQLCRQCNDEILNLTTKAAAARSAGNLEEAQGADKVVADLTAAVALAKEFGVSVDPVRTLRPPDSSHGLRHAPSESHKRSDAEMDRRHHRRKKHERRTKSSRRSKDGDDASDVAADPRGGRSSGEDSPRRRRHRNRDRHSRGGDDGDGETTSRRQRGGSGDSAAASQASPRKRGGRKSSREENQQIDILDAGFTSSRRSSTSRHHRDSTTAADPFSPAGTRSGSPAGKPETPHVEVSVAIKDATFLPPSPAGRFRVEIALEEGDFSPFERILSADEKAQTTEVPCSAAGDCLWNQIFTLKIHPTPGSTLDELVARRELVFRVVDPQAGVPTGEVRIPLAQFPLDIPCGNAYPVKVLAPEHILGDLSKMSSPLLRISTTVRRLPSASTLAATAEDAVRKQRNADAADKEAAEKKSRSRQVEQLQHETAELRTKLAAAELRATTGDWNLTTAQQQTVQAQGLFMQLKTQFEEGSKYNAALEEKIANFEKEVAKLKEEEREKSKELRDTKIEIQELETELDSTKDSLQSSEEQKGKKMRQIDELTENLTLARRRQFQEKLRADQLERDLEEAHHGATHLKSQLHDSEAERRRLETRLRTLEHIFRTTAGLALPPEEEPAFLYNRGTGGIERQGNNVLNVRQPNRVKNVRRLGAGTDAQQPSRRQRQASRSGRSVASTGDITSDQSVTSDSGGEDGEYPKPFTPSREKISLRGVRRVDSADEIAQSAPPQKPLSFNSVSSPRQRTGGSGRFKEWQSGDFRKMETAEQSPPTSVLATRQYQKNRQEFGSINIKHHRDQQRHDNDTEDDDEDEYDAARSLQRARQAAWAATPKAGRSPWPLVKELKLSAQLVSTLSEFYGRCLVLADDALYRDNLIQINFSSKFVSNGATSTSVTRSNRSSEKDNKQDDGGESVRSSVALSASFTLDVGTVTATSVNDLQVNLTSDFIQGARVSLAQRRSDGHLRHVVRPDKVATFDGSMDVTGPFDENPTVIVSYLLPDDALCAFSLKLPLCCAAFCRPLYLTPREFEALWDKPEFNRASCKCVFKAKKNFQVFGGFEELREILELGDSFALLDGIDTSLDRAVAAGELLLPPAGTTASGHSPRSQPCIYRLEWGRQPETQGKVRLVVRSPSSLLSSSVKRAIIDLVGDDARFESVNFDKLERQFALEATTAGRQFASTGNTAVLKSVRPQ